MNRFPFVATLGAIAFAASATGATASHFITERQLAPSLRHKIDARPTVGPRGPQGAVGATGPQGAAGKPGEDGLRGSQGLQGDRGLPGTDGRDGRDGRDGAVGPQGPAGSQGPAGQDGVSGLHFQTVPERVAQAVDGQTLPLTLPCDTGTAIAGGYQRGNVGSIDVTDSYIAGTGYKLTVVLHPDNNGDVEFSAQMTCITAP